MTETSNTESTSSTTDDPDAKVESNSTTDDPSTNDPIIDVRLTELGLNADQIIKIKGLGAETVADLSSLVETDLTGIGIPVLKARKIVSELKPAPEMPTMDTSAINFDTVLPSVPDDTSWLNALRSGGVLKIETSTVISAIRAALADRFGLYSIPRKLVTAMEDYIEVTEEQVGEEFWKIRKQLTRKSYGDLFQAIDGLDGSFVTDKRKDDLLGRINETLWPSIIGFNDALVGWQESWMQGAANPGMMMAAIMSASGAGGGVGMPPGMMQPPDCGVLRDAAESVNDSLNRTFRGTGVQITAALAYEANQIKSMLENSRMPMLCGVASRDLLLKKLVVAVPATYPRMEQNLSKFVLGIIQTDRVAAGNEELQYFGTLYMLGSQIPWGELQFPESDRSRRPQGIGNISISTTSKAHEFAMGDLRNEWPQVELWSRYRTCNSKDAKG